MQNITENVETTISTINDTIKNVTLSFEGVVVNNPPDLSDVVIEMDWNTTYTFSLTDITNKLTDQEGDSLQSIKIIELPLLGIIKLNNQEVELNQVINHSEINQLTYTPPQQGYGLYYAQMTVAINDQGLPPNPFSQPQHPNIRFDVLPEIPPVVSGYSTCVKSQESFDLQEEMFIQNYYNQQNGVPQTIKIVQLPQQGVLMIGSDQVQQGQQIPFEEIDTVTYTSNSTEDDQFLFSISDDQSSLFSQPQPIQIEVNNPPQINANTSINVTQGSNYNFTAIFFNQLYNDIDGNDPGSVIIEQLPTQGQLQYNNFPVELNQQISLQDLSFNSLIYTPNTEEFGQNYTTFKIKISDNHQSCTQSSNTCIITINVEETTQDRDLISQNQLITMIYDSTTTDFTEQNQLIDLNTLINGLINDYNTDIAQVRIVTTPTQGIVLVNQQPIQDPQNIISASNFSNNLVEYWALGQQLNNNVEGDFVTSFDFELIDEFGNISTISTATIQATDTAPIVTCDIPVINSITVAANGSVSFDYLVTPTDLGTPQYQIAADSQFVNIIIDKIGFDYVNPEVLTDQQVLQLPQNQTLYLRVRKHCITPSGTTLSGTVPSQWSEIQTFTIEQITIIPGKYPYEINAVPANYTNPNSVEGLDICTTTSPSPITFNVKFDQDGVFVGTKIYLSDGVTLAIPGNLASFDNNTVNGYDVNGIKYIKLTSSPSFIYEVNPSTAEIIYIHSVC